MISHFTSRIMKENIKTKKITDIEQTVKNIIEENHFTLVETELHEGSDIMITLYIYNSQDATVDKIGKISKILYPVLEKLDFLRNGFSLEVSSPGLYRTIKSKDEFTIFKGREVKLVDEEGSVFLGIIEDFENDNLNILTKEKKEISLNLEKIKKASLNG